MNELNPYESAKEDSGPAAAPASRFADQPTALPILPAVAAPAVSAQNTLLRRFMAANVDTLLAYILAVLAAQYLVVEIPGWQVLILVVIYLGYFWLFEGLLARTPGKLLAGLVVVQFDGRRCTWRQTLIRTLFRILEVNPILLGALPAGLSIVFSQHRQRFGDKCAQTVVVLSPRWRKYARTHRK